MPLPKTHWEDDDLLLEPMPTWRGDDIEHHEDLLFHTFEWATPRDIDKADYAAAWRLLEQASEQQRRALVLLAARRARYREEWNRDHLIRQLEVAVEALRKGRDLE